MFASGLGADVQHNTYGYAEGLIPASNLGLSGLGFQSGDLFRARVKLRFRVKLRVRVRVRVRVRIRAQPWAYPAASRQTRVWVKSSR